MEVAYARCAGLDVHKRTVVACRVTPGRGRAVAKETRTFGTMTGDLEALADWLAAGGCTHVAMESTGVYWWPVWNALEDRFALLLANARHVKAVPGRKTDVKDAEWLADLLRHGLIRGSFVPPRAQRQLRELVRYRAGLVAERTRHVNRLQKVLEGANIKLGAVASDVLGVSGRLMLEALVDGITEPELLAELAAGRLREKLPALERSLAGTFEEHHRFLVAQILAALDFLDDRIEALSRRIATLQRPVAGALERLDAIPGVGRRTAEVILAELGPDLAHFASAGHLASWAGLCPGQDESAGKRRSGATRRGNRWLRAALVEAAHAAARTRTFLGARYHRLARRLGKARAAVAVAHSILGIVYHLLSDPDATYRDLGHDHFDRRDAEHLQRYYVRRLERLGYDVQLAQRHDAA